MYFSDATTLNPGEIELTVQNSIATSSAVISSPAMSVNAGKHLDIGVNSI